MNNEDYEGVRKMYYQQLLDDFVSVCKSTISEQLIGIYLHGSLAMGCFHSDRSDIDLIVIIENNMTDDQKLSFMNQIVELNNRAPVKGLEISVVKRRYCNDFVYPTPFELHFSLMHLRWFQENPNDYIHKMNGVDCDLATHFTMIMKYGVALYGEEISNVFNEVPKKDYIDSICKDIKDARKEIIENPVYVILNLCRTLAFLKEDLYLSKDEGGQWGLSNISKKYSKLISESLTSYRCNEEFVFNKDLCTQFVDKMLLDIENEIAKFYY